MARFYRISWIFLGFLPQTVRTALCALGISLQTKTNEFIALEAALSQQTAHPSYTRMEGGVASQQKVSAETNSNILLQEMIRVASI